jgi:L,D-transpeptidase catalytic domain
MADLILRPLADVTPRPVLVYFRFMARNFSGGAVALLAAAALAPAGTALAAGQTTTTTPTTTTTTTTTPTPPPKPKPKPKPAKAAAKIYLPNAYFVSGGAYTIPGRGVDVHGVVFPYVPGQHVTLTATVGSTRISQVRLNLRPSKNRHFVYFTYRVKSPSAGAIHIKVVHKRTSKMLGFVARRTFTALDTHIGFGSTGRFVQLMQQRLAFLHFYLLQNGVYDSYMGLAIDAYHRLLGWGVSQSLDSRTISFLLNGWGEFKIRFPNHGRHAEGYIGKQLLALIDGSHVQYIFPISSGKPSTPTILGDFRIYRRTPGYLPDGMYYSSFFIGGYAIHGYNPAPDYPASHGCMRLPIQDAIFVYNWLDFNEWVDTYL